MDSTLLPPPLFSFQARHEELLIRKMVGADNAAMAQRRPTPGQTLLVPAVMYNISEMFVHSYVCVCVCVCVWVCVCVCVWVCVCGCVCVACFSFAVFFCLPTRALAPLLRESTIDADTCVCVCAWWARVYKREFNRDHPGNKDCPEREELCIPIATQVELENALRQWLTSLISGWWSVLLFTACCSTAPLFHCTFVRGVEVVILAVCMHHPVQTSTLTHAHAPTHSLHASL